MSGDVFTFDGFEPANTVPVPDTLFDTLLTELTGTELKVLLYIIRRTRGFKKDTDAISLSQMQSGITTRDGRVLDKGCGIKRRDTILEALNSLKKKKCITIDKQKAPQGDNATTVYGICFKEVVTKPDYPASTPSKGSHQTGLPQSPNRTTVVTESDYGVVTKPDSQETVVQQTALQETVQQENTDEPPFFKPLSSKQIQKQNEVRASEIWTLIETELKTTFTKTQRASTPNQRGMNNLLEDETSDATITKALKNLTPFYLRQFNLTQFHGLIPGLTSDVVEPIKPSHNGSHKPDAPPSYEVIHNTKDPRVVALLRGDILDDDPDIFPGTGNKFTREKVYERNALYRDDVTTGVPRTHQERYALQAQQQPSPV